MTSFAGPVAECKKMTITGAAIASYRSTHGLAAGQFGIKALSSQTLLLVSDNLEKHEVLIDAALATTTVVAVKYDTWSLDALWEAIERRVPAGTAFDAVGILDHGAPGRFCLLKSVGGGDIDLADLASSDIAAFFKEIGGLVKPGGRIDLLGCSVAAGPAGRALLAQVEALTGVTVTASTDTTGGAEGADWIMETHDLQAIPEYFHADKIGKWKEAANFKLADEAVTTGFKLAVGVGAAAVGVGIVAAVL